MLVSISFILGCWNNTCAVLQFSQNQHESVLHESSHSQKELHSTARCQITRASSSVSPKCHPTPLMTQGVYILTENVCKICQKRKEKKKYLFHSALSKQTNKGKQNSKASWTLLVMNLEVIFKGSSKSPTDHVSFCLHIVHMLACPRCQVWDLLSQSRTSGVFHSLEYILSSKVGVGTNLHNVNSVSSSHMPGLCKQGGPKGHTHQDGLEYVGILTQGGLTRLKGLVKRTRLQVCSLSE